jgi:hypothetical protein
MLTGSIYGWESGKDDIFDPQSLRNRDDCLEPMRILEKVAHQNGITLHTADVNESQGVIPDFSLYVESINFVSGGTQKNYLILYETALTVPRNADFQYLNQFDIIFTWNEGFIQNGFQDPFGNQISCKRFIKIYYPNPIPKECGTDFFSPTFKQRSNTICLIGSNRHANQVDERELYSARVRAIQWFEAFAKHDFKLYGNGWKVPQKRLGRLGRLRYRLEKIRPFLFGEPVFPSYQGPAETKYEVLSKTLFCICYENARDIDGYITEKIFDCFFAGCIPIYWGDSNIGKYIPAKCFINFREFSSYQDLYRYIKAITPEEFLEYQQAAREFLLSNKFAPFTSQNFADTIISQIKDDFALT